MMKKSTIKNLATVYTGILAAVPFAGAFYAWYKQHKNESISYDEWKNKNNITLIMAYIFVGLNCLIAHNAIDKILEDKNDDDILFVKEEDNENEDLV